LLLSANQKTLNYLSLKMLLLWCLCKRKKHAKFGILYKTECKRSASKIGKFCKKSEKFEKKGKKVSPGS